MVLITQIEVEESINLKVLTPEANHQQNQATISDKFNSSDETL